MRIVAGHVLTGTATDSAGESVSRTTLTRFGDGQVLRLKVSYLNRAQAKVNVAWAWDWSVAGSNNWTSLPSSGDWAPDNADDSSRLYSRGDTKVTLKLVFRCRIYDNSVRNKVIAIRTIQLTYQGPPE